MHVGSHLKVDNSFTDDSHVTIAPEFTHVGWDMPLSKTVTIAPEFDKRISTVQPCSMIVVSILKLCP